MGSKKNSDEYDEKLDELEKTNADLQVQHEAVEKKNAGAMKQVEKSVQDFDEKLLPLVKKLRNLRKRHAEKDDEASKSCIRSIDAIIANTVGEIKKIHTEIDTVLSSLPPPKKMVRFEDVKAAKDESDPE